MSIHSRESFFIGYRQAFGKLRQSQVDGLNITLDLIEKYPWGSVHETAYFLATIYHECDATWWPIEEYGLRSYFDQYNVGTQKGARLGNTHDGDGYMFRGRGYVQLTGRRNYAWAARFTGFPLVSYPDGMKWPELSYRVTQEGMKTGAFTSKKLSDFSDYVQMRRVVNGLDQAEKIASYADHFERLVMLLRMPYVTDKEHA